ncbi:ras-related protein Rab-44 isoform X3 [Macrotis lagotis]|uniref:ras-related protein Rab-44 isoform X3 n=1 Tax=Macrotis lagotis TaxID=92651 RepID=UPI003D69BFDB
MENNPRAGRKSRKLGSRRRHQMRTVADEEDPSAPDTEQLPSQVTEELQDFFRECGAEHKGFITREDLRKAKFSFVSSPEELELIFDWMDLERKGRLTSKEFTSGFKNVFSSQTRIPGPRKRKTRTWIFSKEEPTSFQPLEEADPEERRWFLSFMEQLGTDHLILDQTEIWQLWKKLRQEEPHLVGNLEGFLAKVTSRLQETRAEKEALQMTLKKCDDDHHREVQQLYEEMEQQIHSEKQRIQAESDTQGLVYSSMIHHALEAKEQEVQYLAEGQRELEAQINLLRSKRHEVSMENQRLQETQRALTGQLEQVQGQLQVTRRHLNQAKGQVVWQVEEETSLPSDPPVGPKNISDSQHASLFSEEDPLPSLFEEGDWSQLLKNFTSPLAGNSTQVSWSLTPTPTSLQGHRTPRVVKQISITKSNSWQLNQESPSDPDVPPRSSPGSSAASAVVSELNVADDPRSEVIFQWDFQRVPSGEPAITTGGQAAPLLGESLASLDSLPSQGLDGSGKGIEDTDGDEVRQGDGPTSNMFSKGPGSEVSQQSLVLSADVQASTWKVHPKMSHSGLHPAGSEQEVGSWGKEVFTPGPDGPVKTPELVLIQGSTSKREQEQEKMNTDEWEVETSPRNDASDQETGLRESPGSDVGEVPGEGSRSRELPIPDVGEVYGERSRSSESPVSDVGEVPGEGFGNTEILESEVGEVLGEGSRNRESPVPDVGEVPGERPSSIESSGPDVGEFPAEGARSIESPRPDESEVPGEGSRSRESPVPIVGDVPGEESKGSESSGPDVGEVPGERSRHTESPGQDMGEVPGEGSRSTESPGPDVENAPSQEAGLTESPAPDIEHGGLQDQNPEDVWRAEDRGLQKQAQEGVLFPKDSSGNTLDPQDSGQDLSIPMEAGAQSGSKVPRKQITCPSSEPREESRPEVTKETRHKPKAQAAGTSPGRESSDPDYLFHVLFLGDSNVGKTSFLHLLHHDSFASGLTATVGMDYRIKNLVVDNRRFALQLWDTAGQERYHSITKQFLRKADGIVLMYDVTCPGSFTHVRYWLDCIQEAGPDDVVILLLGNKIDCVEKRLVSTEAGQLLAKEIGVTFGECSAALGHNILEPIVTLARAMKEQDTKLKHSMVDLERKEMKKKSGCCS